MKKLIIILFIFIAFAFGVFIGKNNVVCVVCPPENVDFSLFWEAWNKIEKNFYGSFNEQEMTHGAISGMIDSLDDPYTIFLDPEQAKKFLDDVTGSFEGVGMEIGIREGKLQIIAPLEGTPAQKAGLKPMDKIIKVEDKMIIDLTIDEVISLIRGAKGTDVTLTIARDEWLEPRDITITREVIEIPSVSLEIIEQDIAHIKLYNFNENADYKFRKVALKILNSPVKRIILDLRNNPGGYLEVARIIAGWFLERGDVVAIEEFSKGDRKEYKSNGPSELIHYPITVLINEGSASGSEILAGALRDNRDVKLIGKTSFGKGSVQELQPLSDGSSLKVTVAKWLTPNGNLITDIGLTPDIEAEDEAQLEKAIEIIKELD